MVHRKGLVFDQHRATFERFGDLGHGDDAVIQQREEDGTTFGKKANRGARGIIKTGPSDQSHHTRQSLFSQEGRLVAPENLVLTQRAGHNLSPEAGGEGTVLWKMFGLFPGDGFLECFCSLSGNVGVWVIVRRYHLAMYRRVFVFGQNGIGILRESVFMAWPDLSLSRHGQTSQEIACVDTSVYRVEIRRVHELLTDIGSVSVHKP